MGQIEKQSIRGTIYTYLGAILGFIISVIIFPNLLTVEQIGLLSVLIAYSTIFAQFGSLGFNSTTTRLFSYFRNEKNNHNGFLFIAIIVTLIGFLIGLGIFLLVKQWLIYQKIEESGLFLNYYIYILPLFFFTLFFNTLDHYNKVLYNAIRGILIREITVRIFILLWVLALVLKLINFNSFILFYIFSFCLPAFLITFYLIREKQFNLKPQLHFVNKSLAKSMVSVSLFGIIASATGIITINIDRIMIERMLGLGPTGVYTTCFFFGIFIILPSRSILKISSTFIAEAWKKNDIDTIKIIYKKSTITQYIIGAFLLIGIWVNIDNIFIILNDKFLPGKYVVLLIGLAYLTDMISGVGGIILGTSKYYRMQSVFLLIMIILIVTTNFIFIPKYGIVGAAFSSFISKFAFNLMRYFYLMIKFKMHPINYKFIIVTLIALFAYFIGNLIPQVLTDIHKIIYFAVNVAIKGSVVTIIFGGLILLFNISEDLNNKYIKIRNLLRS